MFKIKDEREGGTPEDRDLLLVVDDTAIART